MILLTDCQENCIFCNSIFFTCQFLQIIEPSSYFNNDGKLYPILSSLSEFCCVRPEQCQVLAIDLVTVVQNTILFPVGVSVFLECKVSLAYRYFHQSQSLHFFQWSSQEENRKLLENKLEGDSLGSNFGKLLLSGDTVNIGCSSRLSYPPDEGIQRKKKMKCNRVHFK